MNTQPKHSRFSRSQPLVRRVDVNARSRWGFLLLRAVAALFFAYFLALFLLLETRLPSVVEKDIISLQKESLAAFSKRLPPKRYAVPFSPYSSNRGETRRAYTPPPRPFDEHKTFLAHPRPPLIEAFLQKGFKQVKDYEDAIFFWYQSKRGWDDSVLKPWQRPNWTPGMSWMSTKDSFLEVLERRGIELPFFPESYRLCDSNSRKKFLTRLKEGGGMREAWVMKVSNSGRSAGITMMGPNSKDLAHLRATLKSQRRYKQLCRREKVIQKYATNLLTYKGRKCNLRAFFPVVSVENPLIVYYHDGYVHTSRFQYNETDFTGNMYQHFSTTVREWDRMDSNEKNNLDSSIEQQFYDAEVSYEDFGRHVTTYVKEEAPHLQHTIPDPLAHIRNQMKAQMVDLMHAFRNVSFTVRGDGFAPENAYVLIGNDFFVDKDLNVIFIESNWFPSINATVCPAINKTVSRMLPEMVDLVSEVYEKQLNGEAVFPLKKVNRFELVYTD